MNQAVQLIHPVPLEWHHPSSIQKWFSFLWWHYVQTGFYYSRRDTTKTHAQKKMKRRLLLMNTICLTSLRFLLCSHSIMKITLSRQVWSHVSYRQTKFALRGVKFCKPTEKKMCSCFNTFDHLIWCITEKNEKGSQIRLCKIRNPTALTRVHSKKYWSHPMVALVLQGIISLSEAN